MLSDFNGCFASLEGNMLCVGNEGIERRWDLSQGAPVVISVLDKFAGREWCGETPYREALRLPHLPLAEPPEVELIASEDDVHGACEPHLKACVSLTYPNAKINWLHRIWPGLPIVMSSFEIRKSADLDPLEAEQFADIRGAHYYPAGERMDHFGLAADHVAYRLARFVARSDYHDNLVKEDAGLLFRKEHHRLSGHYLHLRDLGQPDNGLLALKIGPPCDEQLSYPGYDFYASSLTLAICGSGISEGELDSGDNLSTYAYAVGVTSGSPEAGLELFRDLDRRRHPPRPKRGFTILSNTWGGGNHGKNLSEQMVRDEILAAADIGLTHVQIDAGWHKGLFSDLTVEAAKPRGPYDVDPDFYAIHPDKFPRGFEPVIEAAGEQGIGVGLWFHPDSTNDYARWEQDAEFVLSMYRQYGFNPVKIDGVKVMSKHGEANLLAFFERLHTGSEGKLCVNFDITGGKSRRIGHFYGTEQTGNLFIENRYWTNRTYYPWRTLRNLWQLCKYFPSYRLQMEFCDVEKGREKYGDDPLRPEVFGTEYGCACTLFANPLCWMEIAQLGAEERKRLKVLVSAYRPHQAAILQGRVFPMGEEPCGRAWTGLQSVHGEGEGYLIVFRELTDRSEGRFFLRSIAPNRALRLECLAGAHPGGELVPGDDGEIMLALPRPASYALLKYSQDLSGSA